jgi:hypothetical protein
MARNPTDYIQLGYGLYHFRPSVGLEFLQKTLQLTDSEIEMLHNEDTLGQLMEHKMVPRLLYYNLSDRVLYHYFWRLNVPIDRYRKHQHWLHPVNRTAANNNV